LLFSEKQGLHRADSAINQSINTSTATLEFNETILNTTAREQMQQDVEDRASILERIDS